MAPDVDGVRRRSVVDMRQERSLFTVRMPNGSVRTDISPRQLTVRCGRHSLREGGGGVGAPALLIGSSLLVREKCLPPFSV